MAQQVVIAGALFNDVPSISVPDSNSVYHPFVDPSVTTAAASDVAQGKQFIAADGTLTTGTASGGGGGGLEYETGTWTPASNTYSHTISLAKTHSTAPWFYIIWDATDSYSDTTNTIYGVCYWNYHQLTGVYNYVSSTSYRYGYVTNAYRGSSATAISTNSVNINYPYTDQGTSSNQYSRYWATETSIKAASNSTSRYFRSGRTYKWIAVWTPTS